MQRVARACGRLVGSMTVVALCVLASGCSGSNTDTTAPDDCDRVAADVVSAFSTFVESLPNDGPEDFLAAELEGLDEFQSTALTRIVTAGQAGTCFPGDLEVALDRALADVSASTLVHRFILDSVRNGNQRVRRDVALTPEDHVVAVLDQLGPGSTVTLAAGTYSIDSPVLVPIDLTIVGAGSHQTVIESSAQEAALAVVGDGALTMQGVALRHVGTTAASVLLSYGSGLELIDVHLSGGVADGEGAGGNGLVIGSPTAQGVATVVDSAASANQQAGVVITGDNMVNIRSSAFENNGACGICFLSSAEGEVSQSRIEANEVGVQIAAAARAELRDNDIKGNVRVGVALDDSRDSVISGNRLDGNGAAGIQVVGPGAPQIIDNDVGSHEAGVSVEGRSAAVLTGNRFEGGAVGLQVAGTASPTVQDTTFRGSTRAALLVGEQASGTYEDTTVEITEGAGVVVGGSAMPAIARLTVDGGDLGVAFGDDSGGTLSAVQLRSPGIGVQVGGAAEPMITDANISLTGKVGAVFGDRASGSLRDSTLSATGPIGVQVSGEATPSIQGNTIEDTTTGVSVLQQSAPELVANQVLRVDTGIDIGDSARPLVTKNQIIEAADIAVSVRGSAGPVISENQIIDAAGVGVQILDNAAPTITTNIFGALRVETSESGDEAATDPLSLSTVGLLYAGTAQGVAEDNAIFSFDIGVQVGQQAAPSLLSNSIDGSGFAGIGILYQAGGAGLAQGNRIVDFAVGIQLVDGAPEILDTTIDRIRDAAVVVSGVATGTIAQTTCPAGFPGIVLLEQAATEVAGNGCTVTRP